ncbi:hypothetical protein M3Y94_00526700 [Aphelenchoides besseyi]|nr:hypothetical protein M3Y94_00526700 [Aphelenchoides besseyi]
MFEYRREFGDYDLEKLSDGNDADGSGYRCRVPMYYSNLAERILPVVDILFLRSFEVKIDKPVLEQFLKAFAPVYRYHPQPITFLYKLSYVLDGLTSSENLRRFVGVVCKHLEDDKHSPRYSFLSQEFVIQQHKMPAVKICNVIAERVVAASTYNHQPPEFVARDWRIAEFAPAAQALISGCLELMISSKEAQEIVDGLVEVSMSKPVKRPTDRLNAVAMLLCNLPKRFQYIFFKKVEQSFCWNELKENGPDYLFSSYNIEIMQYSEDKIMGMLALMHAFIQHANVDSLALLSTEINTRFAPKVENETQLIYYLRILTVYLMKIIDREKDSSSQYLQLIITIYDMIPRILEKQSKLKYEDLICDLLYEFKYTVPGSAVNRETEMAIARFPEGMREKLKFLPSPGMRDVSNRLNSHITHPVLTEMCDHGFKNIFHLSDLLTNDKDHTAPQQPPGQMNAAPLPYSNVPQQNSNMSDVVTSTPMPAQNSANQTPIPSVPNSQGPFPHSNQMHSNQQAHFPTTYPNQPMGQIPPQMMPQTSMNHPHPQQHPSMNGQPGHFHPQGQFPYPQQQMQGPYFMGGQPQNVGMHGQPMNYPNQQPPFPTRHPNMNQNQMMYNQYGQNPNPMMPARPPYQHYNQMPPM